MCDVGLKYTLLNLHLYSDSEYFIIISLDYMIFPMGMKFYYLSIYVKLLSLSWCKLLQIFFFFFKQFLPFCLGTHIVRMSSHKPGNFLVYFVRVFWCWHRDTLATKWCQSISTVHARSGLTSPVSNHPGSQSLCRSAGILELQLIRTTLHTHKTLPSLIRCGTLQRILIHNVGLEIAYRV